MFVWTFDVEGSTIFPLDMLRRDCCFPYGEAAVEALDYALSSDRTTPTTVRVRLCRHSPSKREAPITVERWLSFGWTVVPNSVKVWSS